MAQEKKEKLTYEDLKLPTYVNNRKVLYNLTASDLAIAAVLGNINLFLIGTPGCGKSQLAMDIHRHYFGGNIANGGNGMLQRVDMNTNIYKDIFTEVDPAKLKRVLIDKNADALSFFMDEINRVPGPLQNQFFPLGDNAIAYLGQPERKLGKDGYSILMATANIGNGDLPGTFPIDSGLFSRLHAAINFDNPRYKPTIRDEIDIDVIREIDPNVKFCPIRDISDLLRTANKEVKEIVKNPGLEALAAVNYLRFGLRNCMLEKEKPEYWPRNCPPDKCKHNKEEDSLCSLIKAPQRRDTNALIQYAGALQFLAKLKDPKIDIDFAELVFEAFKITGSYKYLFNPNLLNTKYCGSVIKMGGEVVDGLKEDFRKNEDMIVTALEGLEEGERADVFYKDKKGNVCLPDGLTEKAKKQLEKLDPFNNNRHMGLGWMKDFVDAHLKLRKAKEEQEKKDSKE
ncbi:AAA family ATPase [Nanoarchaeota archaeon]